MLRILLEIFGVAGDTAIRRVFARAFGGPVRKLSLEERRNDPVYKKNLERLIERNREIGEAEE